MSSDVDQLDETNSNIKPESESESLKDNSCSPGSNDSGSQTNDSNMTTNSRNHEIYSLSMIQCNEDQSDDSKVQSRNNACFNEDSFSSKNQHSEEPEQMRKLFIGGLDYKTSETVLKQHFERFGEVIDCVVMREPQSKRSRGFGFVIYKHSSMVDRAQDARPHGIEGREVQSKRAISREDSGKPEAQATVKKVYLGGISDDIEESELRSYFKEFGHIVNVNIVTHKDTGKRRGFAFVEFDDYDPVDKIVFQKYHTIKDKRIEAKKAIPKNEMDARKRVDPRMTIPGSMVRTRGPRGASDTCLWEGSYGSANYQPVYNGQASYDYPSHSYHHSPNQYGPSNWPMSPGGASGGPYGNSNGFRGSHGNNPYGRNNNYNLAHPSGWPGSPGPEYGAFTAIPGAVVGGSGGVGSAGGPIRLTHQYRWGPYGGSGHGGAYRGRGHNS